RARGYVAGAISDAVAVSLAGGYVSRDGYTENTSGTGPDLDDADLLTARAKLRADIGNTELVVSADVLRDRGKPSFFEVTDVAFLDDPSESTPFTVNQDQPNFLDRDINGISLTATTDFGGPTWTNVVGYRDSSFDAGLDDDKLPVRYFVDFFSSDTEFVSLESRIAHSLGDRVDYMIGVYYFDQQADNISNFALGDFLTGVPGVEPPIDLTSSVDTESIAIFFNTDWALTDQLSLEVGGRYVTEDKTATHVQDDQTGIFGSTDFSADRSDTDFSPTVSLSYAFADGLTGYLRYAEGFKSAGFNTDFVTATSNLEVEPEEATALEAGLKARLGDAARLNLALFTTDYENLQLSQIVGGGVSLNNAAEATINGIEADIVIAAGDYFDINASLGYLDATYDEFTGCPVPGAALPGTTQADCSGNMLNLAPEWSANLGVQWTYPMSAGGNLIARADWSYRSEVFFEPQNTDRLSGDDRSLLDVRVGYATETWEVFAWARNATDEVYENFADDRSAIFVNTTTAYGPPRMYGVTARMRFGNGN
ncbi:MAG: TonB-dependent receptor, partial [Pseudomonadota bacterium]